MLSKSQYTKYLQCPKALWLYRKDKSRLTPPSAWQQQVFDTGTVVGELACKLFPGGDLIPFDITDTPGMAARTLELIDAGVETIYEASFIHDDLFVAVDILHRQGGFWHLYEVKSSSSVKDTFIDDAAVQAFVLESSGLSLGSINIVHVNNRYIREEELDVAQLFTSRNITERARLRMKAVPENIACMKETLAGNEPEIPIGIHCLSPYACDAKDYCWKQLAGIPEKSVFTLTTARQDRKFELYESGIIRLEDVPPDDCTPAQRLQILGELHIESEAVRDFVAGIEYPITHLDFESFQPAIPEYSGTRPYSQIPFQYSLHLESGPESLPDLVHKEYLAPLSGDPRRELAEHLLADIPDTGTILTYNQVFEKGVIGKLAAAYPDLSDALLALNERVRDLMAPFKARWYYHPLQNGSYSIKKVLPALVPRMEEAYASLPGVNNGGEASAIWSSLEGEGDEERIDEVRQGLLAYCRLDTLAMVKILEVLRGV